jgi:FAD binding domain
VPTPAADARPHRADILRGLCGGAVHLPGDRDYDEARTPWNLRVDARPAAVAYPAFPDEVADVVRAAAATGLKVAPQGTGHGAPPLAGRLADAVLLRTSALTGLTIDAERRTARVGAGVRWGDVVERAGAAGLAALHMSSRGVGVVGSSLGGGLSWYGRAFGLQCSALTAVEVVLADGTFVRATDGRDGELLWAARGGGGGFGVVTAVEFDLLPVAAPYAGMLVWDGAQADRVLHEWARWARGVPDAVTTVAKLFRAPDVSWLPDGVRGRLLVVVDGAVVADPVTAAEVLAPLRALRPEVDTFGVVPAAALADLHLEPEAPTPTYADSVLLEDLPDAAIDALVAGAGPGSGSRLLVVEVRHLGGALGRPSPRGGALDRMDGDFLVLGVGVGEGDAWRGLRADAGRVLDALAPWRTGSLYLSMVETPTDGRRGLPPSSQGRLQAVRAAADPDGLFVVAHPAAE